MSAMSAVVWKLKSISAITAIVSTRIYPVRGPQGVTLPYIVIDYPPGQKSLGQHAGGQSSFRATPIIVTCVADRATGGVTQAEAVIALVRTALAPTSGVTGTVTWNSVSIDHCTCGADYDATVIPQEGDEVGWPAWSVEVDVYHC